MGREKKYEIVCKNCGKQIKVITRTQQYCSDECRLAFNFNKKKIKKVCVYCKKEFYGTHRITCSRNCHKMYNGLLRRGKKFNMTEEGKKKISIGRKKYLSNTENLKQHALNTKLSWNTHGVRELRINEERNRKISETQKRQFRSGERVPPIHSGRWGKITIYKDIKFKSTWEAKVAKWLDDNDIKWEYETAKCRIPFNYDRTYICDFYLPDLGLFLEVKGRWDRKSINKCNTLIRHFEDFDKLIIVDKSNIDNISLDNYWKEQSFMCHTYEDEMRGAELDWQEGAL